MNKITGLAKFECDGAAEGGLTLIYEGLNLAGEFDGAPVHVAAEPADVAIKREECVILAIAISEVEDGGRITARPNKFCHLLTIWDPVFILIE